MGTSFNAFEWKEDLEDLYSLKVENLDNVLNIDWQFQNWEDDITKPTAHTTLSIPPSFMSGLHNKLWLTSSSTTAFDGSWDFETQLLKGSSYDIDILNPSKDYYYNRLFIACESRGEAEYSLGNSQAKENEGLPKRHIKVSAFLKLLSSLSFSFV